MTDPLLQLDHVTKRFGRVVIAEKLSLTVGAGDTVGIVGPNGAGKTSLFEVAYAAMTAVNDPHNKTEVAAALFNVNIEGIAGQLNWTSSKNPAPGVVDTPCVGVQWKPSSKYGWSMEVVDNTLMPNVPLTATLEPTNK